MTKKERALYPDMIRVVALICILIIHFNASSTGMWTVPDILFPSRVLGGCYLGDIGTSLFFIISGAGLTYSARKSFHLTTYYKKRFKAIYPMFWFTWFVAFCVFSIIYGRHMVRISSPNLIFTALGIDGYLLAFGSALGNTHIVGEWFLGCIIPLYILFPALLYLYKRKPVLSFLCAQAAVLILSALQVNFIWFFMRIPEILFGMLLVKYLPMDGGGWKTLAIGTCWSVCIMLLRTDALKAYTSLYTILLCYGLALMLAGISRYIHYRWVSHVTATVSKYSYSVFLIHHAILYRMYANVVPGSHSVWDTALLFVYYLLLTAASSWGLQTLYDALSDKLRQVKLFRKPV